MFKFILISALLATAAFAEHHHGHGHGLGESHASSSDDAHAETKIYDADVHEHGFRYAFETTNHIKAFSEGDEHGNVHGDFQWISPEGEHVDVNYVANEDGYQPSGHVLPTPHPIPEAIVRSLEYIASHPHYEGAEHQGPVHQGHSQSRRF